MGVPPSAPCHVSFEDFKRGGPASRSASTAPGVSAAPSSQTKGLDAAASPVAATPARSTGASDFASESQPPSDAPASVEAHILNSGLKAQQPTAPPDQETEEATRRTGTWFAVRMADVRLALSLLA